MNDLHDYLDDRLSPAERAAFERRIASDPELARRLRDARELREALRAGDAELSPGFYTRTVARFEAEQRKRTRLPFGLAWSTVGLAAATLAAAAIFLPLVLREGVPIPPARDSEIMSESPAAPDVAPTDPVGRPGERSAAGRDAGENVLESPLAEDQRQKLLADGYVAGSADDEMSAGEKKEALAPQPPPEADGDVSLEQDLQAAPPPPAEYAPEPPERSAIRQGMLEARADEAPRPIHRERGSWVLPAGAIEPGALRLTPVPPAGFPADSAGAMARAVASSPMRFLLVGRRPGLEACSSLILEDAGEYWSVGLPDGRSSDGAVDCSVPIPADGRPVRFDGEPIE